MSDFGANTSDFGSDFLAGLSDYASDFCDFPGDSDSDFTREVRHSGSRADGMEGPDQAPQRTRRRRSTAAGAAQVRRQAVSASGKPRSRGQRHAIRPQTMRTAHAERWEYRDSAHKLKRLTAALKLQIRHTQEKHTEYTGSKGKPRTACAMRGCGHFWSFTRSKSKRIGCNRIYNRIKGGTSFF